MNSYLHLVGPYDIVGHRDRHSCYPTPWIVGRSPGYGPVRHHSSVNRGAVPGLVLIGLGLALFLAAWAHRRQNHD